MLKISGSRAIGSGREVRYLAQIVLEGSVAKWDGSISLVDDEQYPLRGGALPNLSSDTVEEAVRAVVHEQIESGDVHALFQLSDA